MVQLNPGSGRLINVDGALVEEDALRIVEQIAEYDPRLHVVCLVPEKAAFNDAPFILCEEQPDGTLRRVFEFWELDARILERIRMSDGQHQSIIKALEDMEAKIKKDAEQKIDDDLAASREKLVAIAANNTNSYSYIDEDTSEKVTIYDDRPSVRQ